MVGRAKIISPIGALSFSGSLELHPTGLQTLYLTNFRSKERAQSQQQRQPRFNGWDLTCLKQGLIETLLCGGEQAGCGASLCSGVREGKVTSYKAN